jgi:hypothetical protein
MSGSNIIGGISVTISATTDKFVKGVRTARKVLGSFVTSAKNAIFSLKGLAVAFAAGAFVKFTGNAMESIAAMGDLSDKLGVSTENLAGLQLAAEEAGISAQTLEKAMVALNTNGMGGVQGLRDWITETSKLTTHQERLAAATKMFGSRGSSMVRLLGGGTAALDEAQRAAEGMGLALDRASVVGVDKALESFARLKMAVGGIFRGLAVEIAPFVEVLSTKLTAFLSEGGKAKSVGATIANAIIDMTGVVADGIQLMVGGVLRFVADMKGFILQFRTSAFAEGIGMGFASNKDAGAAGSSLYQAQRRAGDWEAATPWSMGIESAMAEARKSAAAEAISKQPKWSETFGGIGQSIMKNPNVVNAQQLGGAIAKGLVSLRGKALALPGQIDAFRRENLHKQIDDLKSQRGGMASSSLSFAESGSADSYRQRAAIRRQSEGEKIWKDQLRALLRIADATEEGTALPAANI